MTPTLIRKKCEMIDLLGNNGSMVTLRTLWMRVEAGRPRYLPDSLVSSNLHPSVRNTSVRNARAQCPTPNSPCRGVHCRLWLALFSRRPVTLLSMGPAVGRPAGQGGWGEDEALAPASRRDLRSPCDQESVNCSDTKLMNRKAQQSASS